MSWNYRKYVKNWYWKSPDWSWSPDPAAPVNPPHRAQWLIIWIKTPGGMLLRLKTRLNLSMLTKNAWSCSATSGWHQVIRYRLVHALRHDPDVIVLGEMRDLDTISTALRRRNRHLVIGTLHTTDCVRTINRVIDMFPPAQQHQSDNNWLKQLRRCCHRFW